MNAPVRARPEKILKDIEAIDTEGLSRDRTYLLEDSRFEVAKMMDTNIRAAEDITTVPIAEPPGLYI